MRHQEKQVPGNDPKRLPALLTILNAILTAKREWIRECQHRNVETNAVFSQVDGRLDGIPFKPDQHWRMLLHFRIYSNTSLMLGKNLLWVAKQHGHSVEVMLRMYAAWLDDATEADIQAIKQAMKKDQQRASPFPILEPQVPLQIQRKIARD
jgi:hypothetical protein